LAGKAAIFEGSHSAFSVSWKSTSRLNGTSDLTFSCTGGIIISSDPGDSTFSSTGGNSCTGVTIVSSDPTGGTMISSDPGENSANAKMREAFCKSNVPWVKDNPVNVPWVRDNPASPVSVAPVPTLATLAASVLPGDRGVKTEIIDADD
jgi:hypothetical protein